MTCNVRRRARAVFTTQTKRSLSSSPCSAHAAPAACSKTRDYDTSTNANTSHNTESCRHENHVYTSGVCTYSTRPLLLRLVYLDVKGRSESPRCSSQHLRKLPASPRRGSIEQRNLHCFFWSHLLHHGLSHLLISLISAQWRSRWWLLICFTRDYYFQTCPADAPRGHK